MTEEKKDETIREKGADAKSQESVGSILRRARLAKKQDLRDIASYLCIRYQFLEALEDGQYKELPGEAYANGFIRSYASYLELDPADIISRYKQEFFSDSVKLNRGLSVSEEETENMTPAPKVLLLSFVLLLIAYGLWHVLSQKKEIPEALPEQVESITVLESDYPLSAEEVPAETVVDVVEQEPVVEKQPAVVPPVPPVKPVYQPEPAVTVSVDTVASVPVPVETPVASVSVPKQVAEKKPEPVVEVVRVFGQKNYNPRLVLVATEPTWVEVTRNEAIVFSRLMNKGDRYQVSSAQPEELFLKTGNAGGLEIYCDGQLTQSLGPRGALRSGVTLIPDDFARKIVETME